jgi:formylmethanofuran dehydrogenase subunit E
MTPAPIIHTLSCDECGDTHVELREIERNGWGGEIICRACFPNTAESHECDFHDFRMAQEASE